MSVEMLLPEDRPATAVRNEFAGPEWCRALEFRAFRIRVHFAAGDGPERAA